MSWAALRCVLESERDISTNFQCLTRSPTLQPSPHAVSFIHFTCVRIAYISFRFLIYFIEKITLMEFLRFPKMKMWIFSVLAFFVFCSRLSIIGLFITGDEVERETGRNWNSTFDCCSTHHLVNTCLAAHMLLQRERRFFNPSTRSYILFYEKNKTQTTAKRRERMSETTNSSKPETAKVKLFR